jgi:hypothetical protein
MATPPDFTSGAVLTAAQMNSVGLWLVKSQAVGTGVSSVTVTGAFSTDYENYLIVDSGGTQSVDTYYSLKLGATATGYYYALIYASFLGGAPANAAGNNLTTFDYAGGSATRNGLIEVNAPFLTVPTEIRSRVRYGTVYGSNVGQVTGSTSYTAFTLTPASGTMTGGTIRVYGYRK